jgi:hypothetical protein
MPSVPLDDIDFGNLPTEPNFTPDFEAALRNAQSTSNFIFNLTNMPSSPRFPMGHLEQRRAGKVRDIPGAFIRDISTSGCGPSGELVFQNMPTEIQDTKSANWSATSIIGRSEPIQGYSDSGPRVLSFTLEFAESVDQGDSTSHGPEANTVGGNTEIARAWYVKQAVHWLQSLVYPDYSKQLVNHPPVCLVVIGEAIGSRCICKDVSVTWKGPWEPQSLTPILASVGLTFEEVNERFYGQGPWGCCQVREMTNHAHASRPNKFQALV